MKTLNIINVSINFKEGTCEKTGISVVQGDYNSTKVVFEFDESANDKIKIFEMKNPSDELVYADEIVNNEVILVGTEEVEGQEQIVSLFNEEGDYTFEVSLYGNDSKLTSVCDYITARKEEVVIGDETTGQYLTLFDNLMNELNDKITETNNLNIEAEKEDTTTTITITKKDGTSYDVEILDGEKGEKGDKGDAGAIQMQIVNVLPETGSEDIMYLVPLEEPESQENKYAEYVWVDNKWELLGKIGIEVDLSDYYTKEETYSKAEVNNLIPTKTSDLTNDSDYTTKTYVDNLVGDIETILTTLDIGGGISGN